MKKFVSVVTPTYNRVNKLHRVCNSIKNQTLKRINGEYIFEWIIIDDGSTDNTRELVEKWKNEVDWPIIYKYQENKGKPWAVAEGVKLANGELTLLADSDDEFLPETFETFYNIWNNFTVDEKKKCYGIGVLCHDQYGNRVGSDYPIENKFISTIDIIFKWREKGLGETWGAIKTEDLKKAFNIPDEARHLKFIPESFFGYKIAFKLKSYSYPINKVCA